MSQGIKEISELPTVPEIEQETSSLSIDTKVPEVFTDAQLRRNRRRRWIRMKKLIRLSKKIEGKMHN